METTNWIDFDMKTVHPQVQELLGHVWGIDYAVIAASVEQAKTSPHAQIQAEARKTVQSVRQTAQWYTQKHGLVVGGFQVGQMVTVVSERNELPKKGTVCVVMAMPVDGCSVPTPVSPICVGYMVQGTELHSTCVSASEIVAYVPDAYHAGKTQ